MGGNKNIVKSNEKIICKIYTQETMKIKQIYLFICIIYIFFRDFLFILSFIMFQYLSRIILKLNIDNFNDINEKIIK